jgi:hypothetical protein
VSAPIHGVTGSRDANRQRRATVAGVARELMQERRAELHVVDPVVLLVEVRRAPGGRLTRPRVALAERVRGDRLVPERPRERRIARLEQLRAERERRRHLAGRGRVARRAVLRREQSLWLVGARVHGALSPLAPAVVRAVGRDQVEERVVAVVAELVEHRAVVGEHPRQPLEPVARLVEHVGDAVRAGQPARVVRVGERRGGVAVRGEQVIRRRRRGRDVLEIVRRVAPAAADGDELPRTRGMIHDDAVVSVRRIAEEGVVARPLLAHERHQRVGEPAVDVGPDAHRARGIRAGAHDVAADTPQRAEVEPPRLDARAERTIAARAERAEHDASRGILDGEARERDRPQRADHGHLRPVREIADLIDAHERRAVGR